MKIGEMLKAWRHEARLSVREAAEDIGISFSTLNRIENGKACDSETMVLLIEYLFKKR